MINSDKKLLRSRFRKIRGEIKDRDILDKAITYNVLNTFEYKNADKLFVYWSTKGEVDTRKIIEDALTLGKKVALPKCTDDKGNMQFYYIGLLSDLTEGMYGIMEPMGDMLADDYTAESLCLVPALSFDTDGYRLGYGKGYYDRFLSGFSGVSIGLAYEECLCDKLPRDEYDKKVNYIITNDKIYDLR